MKIISKLKERWKEYKDRRFLKKHGCRDWKEYQRLYDPDVTYRTALVKDFYHGYPYYYKFPDHNHGIYYMDLAYNGVYRVESWCEQNCKGKFRLDCHNVNPGTDQIRIHDSGGYDYYYIAFKEKTDYVLFLLKWA